MALKNHCVGTSKRPRTTLQTWPQWRQDATQLEKRRWHVGLENTAGIEAVESVENVEHFL